MITIFKNLSRYLCIFLIAGCAVSAQMTNTPRSAIEQQLLVRALERAVAAIDTQQFKEKTVAVEFSGLTPRQRFCQVVFHRLATKPAGTDRRESDASAITFASVCIGSRGGPRTVLYRYSCLHGAAFARFRFSEIAVFRDVKHSGHAEIKIFATDAETGDFVGEQCPAIGKSNMMISLC